MKSESIQDKITLSKAKRSLPSPDLARAFRDLAGLTQEDVAQHCGVSRETVSRWEAGTRHPSGRRLDRYYGLLLRLRSEVLGEK